MQNLLKKLAYIMLKNQEKSNQSFSSKFAFIMIWNLDKLDITDNDIYNKLGLHFTKSNEFKAMNISQAILIYSLQQTKSPQYQQYQFILRSLISKTNMIKLDPRSHRIIRESLEQYQPHLIKFLKNDLNNFIYINKYQIYSIQIEYIYLTTLELQNINNQMQLNTQQLSEIKEELKKFSTSPIQKSYKLISQVYKGHFELQSVIDSQITKSFVRIGQKRYTEDDDEKYATSIKICRKLVKQWKQLIVQNDSSIKNEVKQEFQKNAQKQKPSKNNKQLIQKEQKKEEEYKIGQIKIEKNIQVEKRESQNNQSECVQEDKRQKAIDGLKKYFNQRTANEHIEWSKNIEQTIYDQYNHSVQIYMDKVKCIVRLIDRNSEYRNQLLKGELNLITEIINLK